jgi:CheY-like chemotaxis protein
VTNSSPGTFAFYIKARRASGAQVETSNFLSRPPATRIPSSNTELLTLSSPPLIATPPDPSIPATPSRIRRNYHILLVEDNIINQKVLSKQLRNVGCTVHVANHGLEALDFLSKTTLWNDYNGDGQQMDLSIILMDLEMPILDGLTCTRKIRDLEREGKLKGHVPIIAVTANTRMEQMALALEAGMVS